MHLAALALGLLAAPHAAPAQHPEDARIGLLGDVPSFLYEAFREGLRELGYVEGQNIAIEHRSSRVQVRAAARARR